MSKYNNNRLTYYIKNYFIQLIPLDWQHSILFYKLRNKRKYNNQYIHERVNYYNRLYKIIKLTDNSIKIKDLKTPKRRKVYFFDVYEFARFFNKEYSLLYLSGDIIHIPDCPSITKSRPIQDDNANSVLLNLDKIRHFNFIKDPVNFQDKLNKLVWRANVYQEHRNQFMEMHFNNPLCNIGNVAYDSKYQKWNKPRMTIREHLNYKFVLCLEGNDVATNLKWVMSSNSVAVMPKPKYETWFMEGRLIENFHFIMIKDDYSDLDEKLNFYINNPDKTELIVKNAHEFVSQFKNKKMEKVIGLLVLEKYFKMTGQI